MTPSEQSLLKLDRAEEHLAALSEAVNSYWAGDPFHRSDSRTASGPRFGGSHTVTLWLRTPPPPRLSVLLGDCLQNARASLDYLAWALDPSPSWETQFPLARDADHFELRGRSRIRRMPAEVQKSLIALQRYARPELRPLHLLRDLTNKDKHRALTVTIPLVPSTGWIIDPGTDFATVSSVDGFIEAATAIQATASGPGASIAAIQPLLVPDAPREEVISDRDLLRVGKYDVLQLCRAVISVCRTMVHPSLERFLQER